MIAFHPNVQGSVSLQGQQIPAARSSALAGIDSSVSPDARPPRAHLRVTHGLFPASPSTEHDEDSVSLSP